MQKIFNEYAKRNDVPPEHVKFLVGKITVLYADHEATPLSLGLNDDCVIQAVHISTPSIPNRA
jgi:hypothetical protein